MIVKIDQPFPKFIKLVSSESALNSLQYRSKNNFMSSVRSNRTRKNIEILIKFRSREPMFNSVRFDSVSEKSSRVSLYYFSLSFWKSLLIFWPIRVNELCFFYFLQKIFKIKIFLIGDNKTRPPRPIFWYIWIIWKFRINA
jgi:hypothetical protein